MRIPLTSSLLPLLLIAAACGTHSAAEERPDPARDQTHREAEERRAEQAEKRAKHQKDQAEHARKRAEERSEHAEERAEQREELAEERAERAEEQAEKNKELAKERAERREELAEERAEQAEELAEERAERTKELAEDAENRAKAREHAPDNTGRNQRDRGGKELTPTDQANDKQSLERVAAIRSRLVDTDQLSVNAQNLKVITIPGEVHLRGPLASEEERQLVLRLVAEAAPGARIVDRTEVTAQDPGRPADQVRKAPDQRR